MVDAVFSVLHEVAAGVLPYLLILQNKRFSKKRKTVFFIYRRF